MSSSMKDDLRYSPTDCLETFPFPENFDVITSLARLGEAYHGFRAALMAQSGEGLTKTYNRFHSSDQSTAAIIELRRLHAEMDRAVLDAYGWHDIQPDCNFFPEFEDQAEDDDDTRPGRGRLKKFRYRWPDNIHDEVLSRLLALNRERAAAQEAPALASRKSTKASVTKKTTLESQNPGLF